MSEEKQKKSKISNRRKSISTFSKLIEDQEKEFERFIRSSGVQDKIENLIQTSNLALENLPDLMNLPSESDIELLTKQSEGFSILEVEIKHWQEQFHMLLLEQIESSRSILDSAKILESSLDIGFGELTKLVGMLMDLPIHDIQKSLDEYNTFNIDVKEIKPINAFKNDYLLSTTTMESFELGNIKFKTIQDTQLQVQSLEEKIEEMNKNFIEDSKKKDEMLEAIFDYFRNGGSSTVMIKKVKYNKKTAELAIDDKLISIKADTNQHYLCKILFSSKASIKRTWEIDEIVEAMGEYHDIQKGWTKKIYNTVRHLNQKIKAETGNDNFILYHNKTVLVNPKYSKLP